LWFLNNRNKNAVEGDFNFFKMKENKVVTVFRYSGLFFIVILAQFLTGCQATNNTKVGARSGLMGHQINNTIIAAIMNASVGGTAGVMIGRQMDRQADELETNLKGAKVERLGEGILLTFDSQRLFEHDSFGLHSTSDFKDLAKILNKYDYTSTLIEGHTDNVGEELYNQSLSEKRVRELESYLVNQGVKNARIRVKGCGEGQPLAPNETEAGKQMNRRVEIAIYANEEVKTLAKKGELDVYVALNK
jgi:outer membrane protein OmpA-like peptidoglycan-associated protein